MKSQNFSFELKTQDKDEAEGLEGDSRKISFTLLQPAGGICPLGTHSG